MDDEEAGEEAPEAFPLGETELEVMAGIAGRVRSRLAAATPRFGHAAGVALPVLGRLPATVAGGRVSIGWMDDAGDGNRSSLDLRIDGEGMRAGRCRHVHGRGVGGGTDSGTLFEAWAWRRRPGSLRGWFEQVRQMEASSDLRLGCEDSDFAALPW